MEVPEEETGDCTDRAQLDEAVSKDAMFVNTALLVVLHIVCKCSKDL